MSIQKLVAKYMLKACTETLAKRFPYFAITEQKIESGRSHFYVIFKIEKIRASTVPLEID